MRQFLGFSALCLAMVLAGCGSPQSKLESKADECKKTFESREIGKVFFVEREKHWVKNKQFGVKASYDVRQTDSVVTPFSGKIEISEFWGFVTAQSKEAVENLPIVEEIDGKVRKINFNFLYKDGTWIFKSANQLYTKVTSPDERGSGFDLSEETVRADETLSKCLF